MSAFEHPLHRLVRKLGTTSILDDQDRASLLALPYTLSRVEAQTYILREGDPPTQCAILTSGFAFRQKLTSDGARQILSIHIPGEPLDFQNLFLDVADHSLQTLTRAELAFIPRGEIQELLRSRPAIGHAIFVAALIEASILREWILNNGRRDARARIAHLLCEFAARLDAYGLAEEYRYELPMTQEQLADATGLTPVHVSRTLKALQGEGLIVRNKRNVSFPDWEKMRGAGDFNQRYLHFEMQKGGAQG